MLELFITKKQGENMTYKDREDYKQLNHSFKSAIDRKVNRLIETKKSAIEQQLELDKELTNRGYPGLFCSILEDVYKESHKGR